MAELHLLRHAKSSWDDPRLRDHDRPLNARGRRAAAAMAAHMARIALRPALVLCSPAARARQTWEALAPTVAAARVEFDTALYEASAGDLLARLRALPAAEAGPLLLIGHNPGLERLALLLVDADSEALRRMRQKYPTAALASFACPGAWSDLGPAACRLLAFVRPKDLGA